MYEQLEMNMDFEEPRIDEDGWKKKKMKMNLMKNEVDEYEFRTSKNKISLYNNAIQVYRTFTFFCRTFFWFDDVLCFDSSSSNCI